MLETLKTWANEPFKTNMDAVHWFMFMGMLIFIMVLWRFILAHLRGVLT